MNPIDIFIAYAEADKGLMERLRKQLSAAERIGLVDAWHDGEIEVGSNREEASRNAMEEAEIVVLLLSADFFASEYLYEKEMTQALKLSKSGKANVIPVLLKECTWQLTPLSKLQVLPKNEIPVTSEHWKHPDRAFKNIVDEIIRISNHIRKGEAIPPIFKEKPEPTEEIVIQKTVEPDEAKTPLRKLVLYAFAGLVAFALVAFLLNTVLDKPIEQKPVGQEQGPTSTTTSNNPPTETPPPDPTKTSSSTIDLSKVKDLQAKTKIPDLIKDQPMVSDLKKDVPSSYSEIIKPRFSSIKINNLEWSSSNINIPIKNASCYNQDEANCKKLGRLYNFKAATQLCPNGWRLPTKEEWLALSKNDILKLNLTKGGVYRNKAYRELGKIGFYITPERSGGDEVWAIEFRGNDTPLKKDRRYGHWGMSCRCVR